ncbi:MmgE/PrpD family protein [Bounagaea algeriensis]
MQASAMAGQSRADQHVEPDEPAVVAEQIGKFAAELRIEDVPPEVLDYARYLMLDSVGVAFASSKHEFATRAQHAAALLGSGDQPVLALPDRLAPREAAMLNATLIHGLDFDDTHTGSIVHVSASALPAALASAIQFDRSYEELLLAYVLGIEVSARVGLVGHGGFHTAGFHPTGVVGAFGASVASARLAGLDSAGITRTQQIVGSMASGILEFLEDGAWTKRLHPGWAASAALSATAFATAHWPGPCRVYEGRYGLYVTHLGASDWDTSPVVADLGDRWELLATAVKPYPSCHFTHAYADAILLLREQHTFTGEDVARIRCLVHPTAAAAVCEPLENKRRPRDDYDAKFSIPFVVGACLQRGRLTLDEFDDEALADAAIHVLADRVEIADDPDSRFPEAYSAAVQVELRDGTVLEHREETNRGHAERPLTRKDITDKFATNMETAAATGIAEDVRTTLLNSTPERPAAALATICTQPGKIPGS